jgi:hypothetical protein
MPFTWLDLLITVPIGFEKRIGEHRVGLDVTANRGSPVFTMEERSRTTTLFDGRENAVKSILELPQ